MNVVVFEDGLVDQFYPLSLTRPVWELRCGCFTGRERIQRFLDSEGGSARSASTVVFLTRPHLAAYYRERYPDIVINDCSRLRSGVDVLFINARYVDCGAALDLQAGYGIARQGAPLAVRLNPTAADAVVSGLSEHSADSIEKMLVSSGAALREADGETAVDYIWDIIEMNPAQIARDARFYTKRTPNPLPPQVTIIGDGSLLLIGDDVRIDPFVCFDCTAGPVIVGDGCVINSFTRIEGPCFIGGKAVLLGAKVREGCSIGPGCRIGGEVEESVFQANSNKYHDGFIGHSYIGEWVNLGALTTNSDLKNNYSSVKCYVPDRRVNTEKLKVGCFIGDFSKASIGTLINTGTSIGVGCMLVHAGAMPPSHVPSFAWFFENELHDRGSLPGFLKAAAAMTSRRGIACTPAFTGMLEAVHDITAPQRRGMGHR